MDSKYFLLCLIFILSVGLVFATTEIYDYQDVDELIEINNDKVEERLFQAWSNSKILLNYSNDFKLTSNNKMLFRANIENTETLIHKKESQTLRIFATYQAKNWQLGFGSYRPVFGLGTIYKESNKKHYLDRINSKSATDLQGVFGSYEFENISISGFHSGSDLNISTDSGGKTKVVYYDSEKSSLEQSGFITSYLNDKFELSFLSGIFKNEIELEQFNNKEKSYLFSAYSKYEIQDLTIEYQADYQFSQLNHLGQIRFDQEGFTSTFSYQRISSHSLNWFNSGISNKYNSNTEIYTGKCSFPFYNASISLGSEFKSNWEINQWRSKSNLKVVMNSRYSYQISQEQYNDYLDIKQTKYTHLLKAELFDFDSSNITCSYSVNNKIDSGLASTYQIDYKSKTSLGKFRLNMKVIDNYKGEEVLQDNDENIIATFYDFSEDFLIMFNYQSMEYKHLKFNCSFIQSLYNNRINSVKIELSYLL